MSNETENCCPPDICSISLTQIQCSFVNLLPSGPMWDRAKDAAMHGNLSTGSSVVDYAVFVGSILHDAVTNPLWVAMRESSPFTARTTLDYWLERYNWVDCYGSCRNMYLTPLSPFEIMGVCGPEFCAPNYSEDFQLALNSAIVQTLARASRGWIPNLESINNILEPLGAEIVVDESRVPEDPCTADELCLIIRSTRQYLTVPKDHCNEFPRYIPAWVDMGCDRPAGLPQVVWPNLLAAECVARSLLYRRKLCLINSYCADIQNYLQLDWDLGPVSFDFIPAQNGDSVELLVNDSSMEIGVGFSQPMGTDNIHIVQTESNGVYSISGELSIVPNTVTVNRWQLLNRFNMVYGQGVAVLALDGTLTLNVIQSTLPLLEDGQTYYIKLLP